MDAPAVASQRRVARDCAVGLAKPEMALVSSGGLLLPGHPVPVPSFEEYLTGHPSSEARKVIDPFTELAALRCLRARRLQKPNGGLQGGKVKAERPMGQSSTPQRDSRVRPAVAGRPCQGFGSGEASHHKGEAWMGKAECLRIPQPT